MLRNQALGNSLPGRALVRNGWFPSRCIREHPRKPIEYLLAALLADIKRLRIVALRNICKLACFNIESPPRLRLLAASLTHLHILAPSLLIAPGWSRTNTCRFRTSMLYPVKLREHLETPCLSTRTANVRSAPRSGRHQSKYPR